MKIQQDFSTAAVLNSAPIVNKTPIQIIPIAQQLHHEFVRLGGLRFKLKNKMLAILPQIYESGIWKKYAGSIIEYAGKFGDISKTTVIKRLRLEENLANKPFLKAAIEKVGVHKVAMVAKITTPETDQQMAEKLMAMSKMAVQSLSREMRVGRGQDRFDLNVNGADVAVPLNFDNCDLQKSASAGQNRPQPCHAVSLTKKMELDEHSTFLFLKLKKKLGKNLSDKEFIKLILEEREKLEFPQKQGKITDKMASTEKLKSITGETFNEKQIMTAERGSSVKTITDDTFTEPRYVSAKRRRQAIQPTNGKCSYPNCNSPYTVLHHTDRYSESKNHDSVIPLCKAHHEFAHNNLIQNERQTSDQWRLALVQVTDQRADQDTDRLAKTEISQADILYRKYRRELL